MELSAHAGWTGSGRARLLAGAVAATLLGGAVTGPVATAAGPAHAGHLDPGLSAAVAGTVRVIVQAEHGAVAQARRAVERLRGSIWTMLPIVDGFSATVPSAELDRLARDPSVFAVTADRPARLTSLGSDAASCPAPGHTATDVDPASVAAGVPADGAGVGVAVVDTGVSPVADLGSDVSYGPDLSGEAYLVDTFGHGTVMGGIIAGSGRDSAGEFRGVAPGAHLVSVKTAGKDGSVTLGRLLAALGWVSAYRHQYGIRVVNLSLGVPSTQVQGIAPLDVAVDHLWQEGVVVVAAAGNSGDGGVLSPGSNPHVLTVGAYDSRAGAVAPWSGRGPAEDGVTPKPDIVAPGVRVVATLSPGSTIATDPANAPALRAGVDGACDYIRGSGTSQATALTSGAVALLLQRHPQYTPDEVKAALMRSADPVPGAGQADGAGLLDLAGAMTADAHPTGPPPTAVAAPDGTAAPCIGAAGACPVGQWLGSMWSASSWTGSMWSGSMWSDATWDGSMWSGGTWSGSMWSGSIWSGSMWSGSMWSGSMWSGSMWSGSMWSGSMWSSASWADAADSPADT